MVGAVAVVELVAVVVDAAVGLVDGDGVGLGSIDEVSVAIAVGLRLGFDEAAAFDTGSVAKADSDVIAVRVRITASDVMAQRPQARGVPAQCAPLYQDIAGHAMAMGWAARGIRDPVGKPQGAAGSGAGSWLSAETTT